MFKKQKTQTKNEENGGNKQERVYALHDVGNRMYISVSGTNFFGSIYRIFRGVFVFLCPCMKWPWAFSVALICL